LDYNKGVLFHKILSDCSKEEAIEEGIYQFKTNDFMKRLFREYNTEFDEVFVGYEDWFEFRNNVDNKLISTNPKFSTNVGLLKYMPKTSNVEGLHVNSLMGGVSMEASCETGLCAGLSIIKKYNKKVVEYPIYHTNECITPLTGGLCFMDKILYKFNISNISNTIPSSLLLCIYFICIITIIILIIKKIGF
jgi:hypothetical protein